MNNEPIFGIDLGTTCSAIAWAGNGRPTILPVHGEDLLPSVVSFTADGPSLVGRPALNHMALEPERTIRSAKRHMGSDHFWDVDGLVIAPAHVATVILKELARAAGRASGHDVKRVVITVPAWFTQAQRADTRKAGLEAGLEVVRLVNEPTAAALAHAHGQDIRRKALVYDLGGGTFDVSLVYQDGPVVEVLASHGDTGLGGDDFDKLLMGHVLERLGDKDPELLQAVEGSPPARSRLLAALEQAKMALSDSTRTRLLVPFLLEMDGEPRHLEMSLERSAFESLIDTLLDRTMDCVDQVLADGRLSQDEVDELLLVGGSTRIPLVWERLRARYGLEGSAAIPPDRAVVLGAAVQGAIVGGSRVDGILVDVAPFSLSVAVIAHLAPSGPPNYICRVVTPRNAPLPSRHTERFYTLHPRQEILKLTVFQGGHSNPLANVALGEIAMSGIPPAPEGEDARPIDVEFRHDLDGMVDIRVIDLLGNREVAGRVAADGEQVAKLMQQTRETMMKAGWTPGDGSDPDPWHPLPVDKALPEPGETGTEQDEAHLQDDLQQYTDGPDDARALFKAVRRRHKMLRNRYPELADELLGSASQGLEYLDSGEQRKAMQNYDDLADRLFDLGIFI